MGESSPKIQVRLTPIRLILLIVGVMGLFWLVNKIVPIELPSLSSPGTDANWSRPVSIGGGRYGAGLSLHIWNGIPVGVARGGVIYYLNEDGRWNAKTVPGFESEKNGSCYPVAIDAHGPMAIFCDVTYTNKTEAILAFVGVTMTLDGNLNLKIGPKVSLQDYRNELFKNIPVASGGKRDVSFGCLEGTVVGSEFYIPYFARSEDVTERMTSTGTHQQSGQEGPSEYGFLYSSNGLPPWQKIRLNETEQFGTFQSTSDALYLLAVQWTKLWSSTELSVSNWSKPKLVSDTLKGSRFQVQAQNETLHLCWLDERLKRGLGFFIYGDWDVGGRNNLVFYRNCRGGKWNREKRLSGGLSYCGNPTMSVEGQKIVVAWGNYTTPYTHASVYYTVSKNNGRTWSRIYKVESFEGDAGSSPHCNVVLYHGIIHLFYDRCHWPDNDCELVHQWRKFPD